VPAPSLELQVIEIPWSIPCDCAFEGFVRRLCESKKSETGKMMRPIPPSRIQIVDKGGVKKCQLILSVVARVLVGQYTDQ
jgi:hypothetical protein